MLQMIRTALALVFVVTIIVGGIWAIYLVQRDKPRCPKCGNRYFTCIESKKNLWGCRQCHFKGPWSAFDPLAGKGGEDA